MDLISFTEVNTTFGKDQPEYSQLPAHRFADDPNGRIACCWQLTWRERFRVLVTGQIWHQVLTFYRPVQPQKLTVEKPEGMEQS